MPQGTLYIVATPIGNLADISERGLTTLRDVDVIAAEDTRHSAKLLQHFGISTPLISVHDHNEREQSSALARRLQAGESIALISDAGTPLISDPGYHLVKHMREQQLTVVPIPGPSAVITALSIAGLPTNRFVFEGFLAAKTGARQQRLQQLKRETRTLVFYESPHRILSCLQDMALVLGADRSVVLTRELTKAYESVYQGSLSELCELVSEDKNCQRGEIVLVVAGATAELEEADGMHRDDVLDILSAELSPKQASAIAAKLTTYSKNEAYQKLLERKS